MSKEKNSKQTSWSEVFRASRSVSQENKKGEMTTDISGQKCLDSLKKSNPSSLLGRMCKALLTSKTAWYSDRCKTNWRVKVSKSNVFLFQLQASVLGIKEKESGLSDVMYPTPTQDSASERTKKYKQGGTPLPMAVKMFPTPSASCQMDVVAPPETVKQNSKGWSVTRVGTGTKFGAKLNDVVNKIEKMYPTPMARTVLKNNKLGGKLNPTFVEFLMGYPMNWTKIEPTESKLLETQSFHKSQENLEKQSLKQKKMFRTPTSMDIGEDSFIYAAKILKGKVNRSSNSRVQITLSTDVAMEYLKNNPELIDQYDRPFMERPNLPNKLEFIEYLKSQTSIKKLSNNTDIPKTKIEHWFRKDNSFSYPSIEDWNIIKPFLKELKFNKELTYEIEKDWKE